MCRKDKLATSLDCLTRLDLDTVSRSRERAILFIERGKLHSKVSLQTVKVHLDLSRVAHFAAIGGLTILFSYRLKLATNLSLLEPVSDAVALLRRSGKVEHRTHRHTIARLHLFTIIQCTGQCTHLKVTTAEVNVSTLWTCLKGHLHL